MRFMPGHLGKELVAQGNLFLEALGRLFVVLTVHRCIGCGLGTGTASTWLPCVVPLLRSIGSLLHATVRAQS